MKNLSPREMILVSMFAALAAVGAMAFRWLGAVGFVPFSIVPFVVVLAGCILGPRLGALSMFLYAVVGIVGVPVFETAPFGTPAYLFKPTFGFIIGFIAAAYVTGRIVWGSASPGMARFLAGTLAGTAALYVVGLPYLYIILNFYLGGSYPVLEVLKIGFIPFVGWDIVKAVTAAGVARAVQARLYPGEGGMQESGS